MSAERFEEAAIGLQTLPPRSGLSGAGIALVLAALALAIFVLMDRQRLRGRAPNLTAPPVVLGSAPRLDLDVGPEPTAPPALPDAALAPAPARSPPAEVVVAPPPAAPPAIIQPPPIRLGPLSEPAVVVDAGVGEVAAPERGGAPDSGGVRLGGPAQLRPLRDPAHTIVQGALVRAVLETPVDSSRPGLARALVSQDVLSFDRSNVLIPRGSRLVGQYQSDAKRGQSRALILWTRLIRPDGSSIELVSPAADPRGATGVPGRADSQFLTRFGEALLQTVVTLGASRLVASVGDEALVLALPTPGVGGAPASDADVQSSITVPPGASISVFVARDLEFGAGSASP